MSGSGITTHVLKLRLVAWGDLTVWTFLMIPLLGMLLMTVVSIPIVLLAMVALALPAEIFFKLFSRASKRMPAELEPALAKFCDYVQKRGGIRFSYKRFRYMPHDLNVGGRVVGMFSPKVVVSAGLLVSLQKKESKAFAILAHEIAHVAHLDRLNYAYFTLWLINAAMPIVYFLMGKPLITTVELAVLWIAHCIFTFMVCGFFMRERELLADASAALIVGPARYADMMRLGKDSPHSSGGYFHPPLALREQAISMNPPAGMRVRKKALFIYSAFFLIGVCAAWAAGQEPCRVLSDGECYQINRYGDDHAAGLQFAQFFGIAQAIAAFAGLALELFRSSLPISPACFEDALD